MKAFLDTSVLVATFYGSHEHHDASMEVFLRYKKQDVCCAAHTLAEVYATITGMPGKERASADEAMLFLGDIQERLTIISLSAEEYVTSIAVSAPAGAIGGSIYDAMIARCALKAGAETIYTWNLKDFRRLGADIADRATMP